MSAGRRRSDAMTMRLLRGVFLAWLPLALTACAAGGVQLGELQMSGLNLGLSSPQAVTERTNDNGTLELILEPLDVWDAQGAGKLEPLAVGNEKVFFRLREVESFDRAWVRLGLYWNARLSRVHMPIVIVGGPPVRVQKVRIEADGHRETLELSRNFQFTPAKRMFEKDGELHTGAVSLSPETLARIAAAREVVVTLSTNRGNLRVNLSVVTSTDTAALTASSKYQFAQFHRRMRARR